MGSHTENTDEAAILYVAGTEQRASTAIAEVESKADALDVSPLTDVSAVLNGEFPEARCVVVSDQLDGCDPLRVLQAVDSTPVILHAEDWQDRFETVSDDVAAIVRAGDGEFSVLTQRILTHLDRAEVRQRAAHLEEEYNLVSAVASDIFWTFDVTREELVVDSGIRRFGFDQDEIGDSLTWWFDYVHPADRARIKNQYERIMNGDRSVFESSDGRMGRLTTEFTLESPTGTQRDCLVRILCLFDDEGDPVQLIGAGSDVTAQREAQARLKSLVEYTSSVITVVDEDGTYIYNSPSVERVLGYEPSELAGKAAIEQIHPEDRERTLDAFRKIVEADSDTVRTLETRVQHKDGSWVWIAARGTDQTSPALDGYVVTYDDITERKRYQQELERIKRRYDAIFEDPETFFLLLDTDGSTLDVNEAALSLVGTDRDSALGRPFEETPWFANTAIAPEEFDSLLTRVADGETVRLDTSLTVGDKTTFLDIILRPVVQDGSVESIVAIGRDITRIKRRERALDTLLEVTQNLETAREREEVIEQAIHALAEFVDEKLACGWLYDESDDVLRPVAATEEARAQFGELPQFAGGESLTWEAFENDTYRRYDDVQDEPERYDEETASRSEILLPLGGEGILAVGSTQPDAFEEIDFALAQLFATSTEAALERARREQRLREQGEQLKQKNAQLEQVASILSHDLRNPLNVATLRTELAREETENGHLADVEMALDRMGELIDDVLSLARGGQEVTDSEAISIEAIAAECWTVVSTEGATLTVEDSFDIYADKSRFRHVLENLFGNAVEHGETTVKVSIGRFPGGFYVADDGPGIPEAERGKILEAGYTTRDAGTGFGLTIVETIATAHGWDLRVTESESGGARFEFHGVELCD